MKAPTTYAVGDYAKANDIHGHPMQLLQGDDARWAVETHCEGHERQIADDVYSVILIGNEDSPEQVWGSSRVRVLVDSEFERLA